MKFIVHFKIDNQFAAVHPSAFTFENYVWDRCLDSDWEALAKKSISGVCEYEENYYDSTRLIQVSVIHCHYAFIKY